MSLDFTNGADVVDHGASNNMDNLGAATYMAWAYPDTSGDVDYCLANKGSNTVGCAITSNPVANMSIQYFRASTHLDASGAFSNFTSWAVNKWVFIACTYDLSGANGDQRILIGDLTTAATEPSSYATQTVGSGSATDDSAENFFVGHLNGLTIFHWRGRIARVVVVSSNLSNSQIVAHQWSGAMAHGANTELWCEYGHNGTGTQPDWSGNSNNGTVATAVQAVHVPLGPPLGYAIPWIEPAPPVAVGIASRRLLVGHGA